MGTGTGPGKLVDGDDNDDDDGGGDVAKLGAGGMCSRWCISEGWEESFDAIVSRSML